MAKKVNSVSAWASEEAVASSNKADKIIEETPAVSSFTGNGVLNIQTQVVDGDKPRQLAPIIQPIAFVPYSTTSQPLYQYVNPEDVGMGYEPSDNGYYEDDVDYDNKGEAKRAKKIRTGDNKDMKAVRVRASGCSILLMLLSIASILVIVLGNYVKTEYLYAYGTTGALTQVLAIKDAFGGEIVIKTLLFPLSITVVAAMDVLCFLGSLITVKKKGVGGLTKLFVLLEVVGAALFVVMIALNGLTIGYGSYIIAGIAVLSMLIALFSRKDNN